MPNLYATPTEIKAALPDAIRAATVKYDAELLRLAGEVSVFVDNHCHRVFYPRLATRYFRGRGGALRVPDLLAITSVSVSNDNGLTYAPLAASDYFASVEGDVNSPKSWTQLHLDASGLYSVWPTAQRGVKVVGVWAYADDRDTAWERSLDAVANNPSLLAAGVALNVTDADGLDDRGISPRFAAGRLLRIGTEFLENTAADVGTNVLTVSRGRNGSTAAVHLLAEGIDLWRPPEPVKQAVIVQIVRGFERGLQGFSDGRASPELSQFIWTRALDPDVVSNLANYVAEVVHA